MDFSTILLAGGEGKRFKNSSHEYKAFIEFNNKPLFLWILKQLPLTVQEIIIATNERLKDKFVDLISRYQINPKPILAFDEYLRQGPMSGIITGMLATQHNICLIIPCDVPLIKTQVFHELIDALTNNNNAPAVVPRWPNGYREPLIAIYQKNLIFESIKSHFQKGERKISNVLDSLPNVKYVEIDRFRKFDPKLHSFISINSLEDFQMVSTIYKEISKP